MLKKLVCLFFLFLASTSLHAQSITEGMLQNTPTDPIPKDSKVLQDVVWKNYRIQLMVTPPKPYLRGPADFIIVAKKEVMMSPFPGSMTISFENTSKKGSAFQETQINSEDFVEDGVAKISHTFSEPGTYAVVVSLTDAVGDLFVVRGNVEIRPDNFFLEYQKRMSYIMLLFFIGFILFTAFKKLKNRPKN